VIAGKDVRTLAREILEMSHEGFSAAFRRTPMKRAELRGLKRNAAMALSNIGTMEDTPVLRQAIADSEPLVREHVAWALGKIADSG
jgi:epoxyqueuosine reductase